MVDSEVIIAGAGPVGTVLAYYLAQRGVSVLILEAGSECAEDLRASTFHPPTLEMLDTLGIAEQLIARGLKAPVYHWIDRRSGEVMAFDMSEIADATPFPFRIQCEQYHLAQMLSDRLAAHPLAEVRFGHRLTWFDQDDAGVTVQAETATGIECFRGALVVGCDGANSFVRKRLGIDLEGFTYPEKFLCLSTPEPIENYLPNLAHVNYVSDDDEWLVLLRVPSLWRVLVPADPDAEDATLLSDATCDDIFNRLIGHGGVPTHHRTIYRVHQRVARRFFEGRAVIIGDAAHLNNPLGGFGMNSGIHDAFELAPRLVEILRQGAAPGPALKAFAILRHRITRDFVQSQTIQNMEFISQRGGSEHVLRRDRMRRLVADPVARREYLLRQAMIECLAAPEGLAA